MSAVADNYTFTNFLKLSVRLRLNDNLGSDPGRVTHRYPDRRERCTC